MKNFIAGSGGRYVYSEDLINLQELSLSMAALFQDCDNFVISGCKISGNNVSSGYVWINGYTRYFEGASNITFPYYIYEQNMRVSTEYKDEPNKIGRIDYMCASGTTVPSTNDPVTGKLPSFIESLSNYTPSIVDKFFGKYSLVLNHPFSKQIVAKDVDFSGNIVSQKTIEAKTSIAVTKDSISFKSTIKGNNASIGLYKNNLLVTEMLISEDGVVKFIKNGVELVVIDSSGLATSKEISSQSFKTKHLTITDNMISNTTDTTDSGSVIVNKIGYNNGVTKFRDLHVYDGKGALLLSLLGKNKRTSINAQVDVSHGGKGVALINATKSKTDTSIINALHYRVSDGDIGYIGYSDSLSLDVTNLIGDIIIKPKAAVDIKGAFKINGTPIDQTYVSQSAYDTDMKEKIDKQDGKGLSEINFTTQLKEKLDGIKIADPSKDIDGLINWLYIKNILDKKLDASQAYSGEIFTETLKAKLDGINEGRFAGVDDEGALIGKVNGYVTINKVLHELKKYAPTLLDGYTGDQKKAIASNIDVYTKNESDDNYLRVSGLMGEYITYLTGKLEKTTEEAQKILREKIAAAGKSELSSFITKTGLLADLEVKDANAKKAICANIGAAYSPEYQTTISDTGWLTTTATGIYIRQIGNIVCIQGETTAAPAAGNTMFELPNKISPPQYSVQFSQSQEGTWDNTRGFVARIAGGSRKCTVADNRISGSKINFTITYMT